MATSGLSTAAVGLHRWGLPRGLILLLGGAAMVIIVAGIQGVAWLIGPAFMALIVVIAVAPAQSWLRRKGWPPHRRRPKDPCPASRESTTRMSHES